MAFVYWQGIWTATVALLVGNRIEDNIHISGVGDAINTGCRQLFRYVSAESLFQTVGVNIFVIFVIKHLC